MHKHTHTHTHTHTNMHSRILNGCLIDELVQNLQYALPLPTPPSTLILNPTSISLDPPPSSLIRFASKFFQGRVKKRRERRRKRERGIKFVESASVEIDKIRPFTHSPSQPFSFSLYLNLCISSYPFSLSLPRSNSFSFLCYLSIVVSNYLSMLKLVCCWNMLGRIGYS